MTTTINPAESTCLETVVLRKREDLHLHCIDAEAILYDPRTCETFLLNPVALHIWHRCDGRTTIGRVIDKLTAQYNVNRATALGHVRKVLTFFEDVGLLVGGENIAYLGQNKVDFR